MLFKTKEASKYEHHFRKALDAIMQSNAQGVNDNGVQRDGDRHG